MFGFKFNKLRVIFSLNSFFSLFLHNNLVFFLQICSLLDNNKHLGGLSPEIYQLQLLSEFQIDENQLSNTAQGSLGNKESVSWYVTAIH